MLKADQAYKPPLTALICTLYKKKNNKWNKNGIRECDNYNRWEERRETFFLETFSLET